MDGMPRSNIVELEMTTTSAARRPRGRRPRRDRDRGGPDAVTRGLSVLAVDAHDLAFGTSRWSSKLVHGGLRYLAHGQVGDRPRERGRAADPDGAMAPHLSTRSRCWCRSTPTSAAARRRSPGRRSPPATSSASAPAPPARPSPARPRIHHRGAVPRALPQGRRPARRAARVGRAARGRRPPGRDHRPHGRVVRCPVRTRAACWPRTVRACGCATS